MAAGSGFSRVASLSGSLRVTVRLPASQCQFNSLRLRPWWVPWFDRGLIQMGSKRHKGLDHAKADEWEKVWPLVQHPVMEPRGGWFVVSLAS